MLRIRLQRVGRKHEPTFRLVLTESTNSTKSGRFLEVLGSYDPRVDKPVFDNEKIKSWISKGARVTDTVHNLLVSQNVISGKKINILPRKSPPKKEEPEVKASEVKKEESTPEEAPKVEETAPETQTEAPQEEVKTA